MKYSLAIHGGAGLISKDLTPTQEQEYRAALESALKLGREMLSQGAEALEVVEETIVHLEDCPLFNAGAGSVFNHDGVVECDAALMSGRGESGAVTCVRTVKNPIRLARSVLRNSPHRLLAGAGAEAFALAQGFPKEDPHYFHTELRYGQLIKARRAKRITLDYESVGTVGAVALDSSGRLASGSSTGGMTNKHAGRVGDSPVLGAGLWADHRTCAVSCTGRGERFLRYLVAHRIANRMEFLGESLEQAVQESLECLLQPRDGGLIAVDSEGRVVLSFNSTGMFRGAADSEGRFEVAIW